MSGHLPNEVESFISTCIDSVEQVEILLLLSADRRRSWTLAEISGRLRSSVFSVGVRIAALAAHGLVRPKGDRIVYAASPQQDVLVRRLAAVYEHRRATVIDRIFARSDDAMSSFADAFRLRRDEDGDG